MQLSKNKPKPFLNLFAATSGNIIEFYDFVLYGFLSIHLSHLFFPSYLDNDVKLLYSLSVFAVGFLTRPIGAFLFGYIGDKFGRKKSFTTSVLLMSVSTLLIGCLPTFEEIGILAPCLLIILRLSQGLSVGGEYNGAGIFAIEHAKKRKVFSGAITTVGANFGALLGAGTAEILLQDFMPSYAWRFGFFLGGALGLSCYFLRKNLEETPDFLRMKVNGLKKIIIKDHWKTLLSVVFIGGFAGATYYFSIIYFKTYLVNSSLIDEKYLPIIGPTMILMIMGFTLFFGYLGDKISPYRIMKIGILLNCLFLLPIFYMMSLCATPVMIFSSIALLAFLHSFFVAPSQAILVNSFPAEYRFRLVSFGFAIGMCFLGGTTPAISQYLINLTEISMSPLSYLIVVGFFTYVSIVFLEKKSA